MSNQNPKSQSRQLARQGRIQKIIQYLGLSVSGIGSVAIIGFIANGQFLEAIISTVVTVTITFLAIGGKFLKDLWERILNRIEDKLAAKVDILADWIVNELENLVIKLWWRLTSNFQGKYYKTLIYDCRDYRTQGLKTKGPFTLNLEKVFVPLRVKSESPGQISSDIIQTREGDEGTKIWEFLAASRNEDIYRSIVIIGAPGSGKTTLLEHLALIYAQNRQKKYYKKAPKLIPILLYLRDVAERIYSSQPKLGILLEKQESIAELNPRPKWFEEKLKQDKCLVMLDGLDEVADINKRQAIESWLDKQIRGYPKAIFILTSRPFGYENAAVDEIRTVLEVKPFNLQQMEQFIHSWYRQNEIASRLGKDDLGVKQVAQKQANNLIERIKNNSSLASMALNPLLLTMIATVHSNRGALPGRRVELYAEICDVLLGRRQEAKGIADNLTADQKKIVLQVLALKLMERGIREFVPEGESSLLQFIQDKLAQVTSEKIEPQKFLEEVEQKSGLLVEREKGVYGFAHKTFQEYLAAVEIKITNQEKILTNNISNQWWEESIRLYSAQSDATNLISAALKENTLVALKLALDCSEEGLIIKPEVRQELQDKLEAGLESPDKEVFRLAAEVMLARRLSKLLRIEENLEIDTSYITCAEYQLFVDEWLKSGERFQPGTAKRPITEISVNNALRFCAWLNSAQLNDMESIKNQKSIFYRLPTKTEAQDYPARKHKKLDCWTIDRSQTGEQGIRVVKAQLSLEYIKLTNYLSAEEWEKAQQETESVMLQMVGQVSQEGLEGLSIEQISPQTLHIIELLWCQYLKGEYSWFAFDVITVNDHGQESQRKLSQAQYFTEDLGNGVTLDMVSIPGGSFMMGTEEEEIERLVKKFNWDGFRREKPQHKVTVKHFFMGKYQVTQKQWRAIAFLPKVSHDLDPSPSHFKGDDRPVENVSWENAVEFCARLSNKTGREYRFPTEAEWEYACRAGTTTPFYFGETITEELANYDGSYTYANEPKGEYRKKTTPVGSFTPNDFGLYDMHGNVWEWCEDNWHDNYEGAPTNGSAWLSGISNTKVVRGGSWINAPHYCRSACRFDLTRADRLSNLGFRVVCVAGSTT